MDTASDWYYSDKGTRLGPFSGDKPIEFREAGKIGPRTLSWRTSFGTNWCHYADTELARTATSAEQPPPLPLAGINNTFAWMFVATPIVGAVGFALFQVENIDAELIFYGLSYFLLALLDKR